MKNKTHSWTKEQVKTASVPNYGKQYVAIPNILKLMGELRGKSVLELGSGNGHWLELFIKKGAKKCLGIEISKNQIDLAREKNTNGHIEYMQGDITNLGKLKIQEKFDVILLEHVLLEISSKKKIEAIFAGCAQLLKKDGILIISELHPFAPSTGPKNMVLPKDYHYFSSGEIFKIVSKRLDGQEIFYSDYHWTLSDYTESLSRAGLSIDLITEPRPTPTQAKAYPPLAYRLTTPMLLMIRAKLK